jgi:hypothetical protein
MMDDLIRKAQSAEETGPAQRTASSRLKSRILSTLLSLEQAEGQLRTLSETRDYGERLCVFEHAVALLPSDDLQSRNPCAICHARVLGERVENAPIFWPGCPYSRFCGH